MKHSAYFLVIAILASSLFACSTSGDSDRAKANQDTITPLISQTEADTLARSLGFIQGSDVFVEMEEMALMDSVMTQWVDSSYLRGVETALGPDVTSPGYTQGVRAAREIIFKIEELKAYGVEIDRELLLAALERQFNADTITSAHLQELNSIYNRLLKQIYNQSTQ